MEMAGGCQKNFCSCKERFWLECPYVSHSGVFVPLTEADIGVEQLAETGLSGRAAERTLN